MNELFFFIHYFFNSFNRLPSERGSRRPRAKYETTVRQPGRRCEERSVKARKMRKEGADDWTEGRGENEREREKKGKENFSFSHWPSFLCSTTLHAPFPSGRPGGRAGHRRPSFPSPCWPCWPVQTQSSSSGRTPARRGTKGGRTGGVWRRWHTRAPSTQRTRRTEDSLASLRRLFQSVCLQEKCTRQVFFLTVVL